MADLAWVLQFQSIGNGGARTLLPENWKLVAPTLELLVLLKVELYLQAVDRHS